MNLAMCLHLWEVVREGGIRLWDLGNMEKPNKETLEYEDGINVHLEPSKHLQEKSLEIMGVDIDSDNELGGRQTFEPILASNQEGEYTFDFELGALEENPEVPLAPAKEKLKELEAVALDVPLIVTVEGKKIARFDLNDTEEVQGE